MKLQHLQGKTIIPGQYLTALYDTEEDGTVVQYVSGRGTTVSEIEHQDQIVQIIVGTVLGKLITKETYDEEQKTKSVTVSVISSKYLSSYADEESLQKIDISAVTNNLPKENDVVLVKITKLTVKQAFCEIISLEGLGNVVEDLGIGANGEIAHQSLGTGGGAQALSNHSTIASSLTTAANAMASEIGESFKGVIRSQDVRLTDRDKVKIIESFKPGDIVRAIIISLGDGSNYYLSTARNDLGVIYAKSENGAGHLMFPIDWEHMVCPRSGVVEKRKCAKPLTE